MDRRETLNEMLRHWQQIELRVAIYAYGEECFLISATTGTAEAGAPIKLQFTAADSDLGHAIYDLLLQCYAHPKDAADGSLKNWAVFAASGAKTGKAFESKCTYVTAKTINTAIVVEAIRRSPPSDTYVGQQLSITGAPAVLGSAVKKLVATLRLLDSQDAL
ncbi:hypothetical protein [Rhodoferax saidenbachensis]|nr:hypothetical protein [Rhodoferax saidenbachensis]